MTVAPSAKMGTLRATFWDVAMPILFILLFLLGLILSLSGAIIGIVQSFQESATWGLLYLFVPFASLVFVVKFWNRKWVRNSLFLSLGGVLMFIIGALIGPMAVQQAYSDLSLESGDWEEGVWEEESWEEGALEENALADTSAEVSDLSTASPAEPETTTLQPALDLATRATGLTQTAISSDDWTLIASLWQQSIMVLESIPEDDPNYSIARTKMTEYNANLTNAQQNGHDVQ